MEVRLHVPSLRPLVPLLVAAALLGGFMALDKGLLHWYVPNPETDRIAALETATAPVKSQLSTCQNDTRQLGQRVEGLEEWRDLYGIYDQVTIGRFTRMAQAVTMNSLVITYGGEQSTASPAGRACFGYLFSGTGSMSDCGFRPAD